MTTLWTSESIRWVAETTRASAVAEASRRHRRRRRLQDVSVTSDATHHASAEAEAAPLEP